MNVALKKLALLESEFKQQEEELSKKGYSTNPIDEKLRNNVYALMEKVRSI